MGAIISLGMQLFAASCVATVMALSLGVGYLWTSGKIDHEKMFHVLAIVHDVEVPRTGSDTLADGADTSREQPSLDDIEQKKSLQTRDDELKMAAVDKGILEISRERKRLSDVRDESKRLQEEFNRLLTELEEQTESEGVVKQRLIWTKIEPERVKRQIMSMIELGEMDDVVVLFTDLPTKNQSSIIESFTEDNKEHDAVLEILRRIRRGVPKTSLIDAARNETNTQ